MSSRADPSTLSTQKAAGLAPPLNAFGNTGGLQGYHQATVGMGLGSGQSQVGNPWVNKASIGYAYSRTTEPYSFSLEDYAILEAMRRMRAYTSQLNVKKQITYNQKTIQSDPYAPKWPDGYASVIYTSTGTTT